MSDLLLAVVAASLFANVALTAELLLAKFPNHAFFSKAEVINRF